MANNRNEFDYTKLNRTPGKLRRQFGRVTSAFLVVAASILFFFLLLRMKAIGSSIGRVLGILSPIWYGCAFAYLLNPLVRRIEGWLALLLDRTKLKEKTKHHLGRAFSIFLTLAVILALITLLINLLIPQLYKSVQRLVYLLPTEFENLKVAIENLNPESRLNIYLKDLLQQLLGNIESWLKTEALKNISALMNSVTATAKSVVNGLVNVVIGLIACIYILSGKEKFGAQAKKMLYALVKTDRGNFLLHLARKGNEIFSGFLVGKVIDSLIIGVLCFIGMSIFRISENYTLLISVVVGVTNIIPVFGPYFGAIPSAFLLLLENPIHCLYFVIFVVVLQQLDGNVIGPSILGESTGLSAFWVIVAILLGQGLFGFVGLIIGVPTFATLYYVADLFLTDMLERKGLQTDTEEYMDVLAVKPDKSFVKYGDEAGEKIISEKRPKLSRKILILAKSLLSRLPRADEADEKPDEAVAGRAHEADEKSDEAVAGGSREQQETITEADEGAEPSVQQEDAAE